jgi:hypothetical protein
MRGGWTSRWQDVHRLNGHGRAPSKREGMFNLMTINLKHCVWVLALAVGTSVSVGTVQAVAAPFFQEDHGQTPDYSKNKTYQQGVREGKADLAHKQDHSKKRHFKKDEDQKAYEAGYQQGRNKPSE